MRRNPSWCAEDGASTSEYAILAALIAVVIAVAVTTLGMSIRDLFTDPVLTGVFVP